MKYHISPSTGNPNKCTAKEGHCPFATVEAHYGSKDEARKAYEATMSSAPALKKAAPAEESFGQIVHRFPAERLEEAKAAIAKANRRLEKFSIDERFTYTAEVTHRRQPPLWPGGPELSSEEVTFTLNRPSVAYAGQRFLAVVTEDEGGLITRTGSDVELHGWRPKSMACEHCGQNRARSKTYLVEDAEGTRRQIGSTCVEGYLGVRPEGLWALSLDPTEAVAAEPRAAVARGDLSRPADYTIALALAVSNGGEDFVSRSRAYDYGGPATVDSVEDVLWGTGGITAAQQARMRAKAAAYLEDGTVAQVLEVARTLEGDSDYATNLRTAAAGEWIKPQNTPLLVSALSTYRHKQERAAAEARPKPTAGFAGEVKEKMKDRSAVVTKTRSIASTDYYGNPITKTQVVFQDEAGHEMVWWASSHVAIEEGAKVKFTGGSIKAHSSFQGVDQTVLTRVKMEKEG